MGHKKQHKSREKACYTEKDAKMAKEILERYGLHKEKIDKIVYCVGSHRTRSNKVTELKEAKILFDANKLNSIGAIGLARTYVFAGEVGAKVHDKNVDVNKTETYSRDDTNYREFLAVRQFIEDRMFTKEGKRMAKARYLFMVEFFERINKEVDGEI